MSPINDASAKRDLQSLQPVSAGSVRFAATRFSDPEDAHLLNVLTRLIAADPCSRAALHPAATSYVPVGAPSLPGEKYPLGDIRLRGMTHHLFGAYVEDVTMDRNPYRRSQLWMLPGDWRKSVLDHAEERTSAIHALNRALAG